MLRRALFVLPLAALIAAGCSSSHPAAQSSSTTTTAPTSGVNTTPKEAAIALGRAMLDEAVLPPGARVSIAPALQVLRGPGQVPAMGNLVFAHRTFTVDESPHAVWQWLQAHPPKGFLKRGTSSGTSGSIPSWGVEDELVAQPTNVSYAELLFGIAGDASGNAVVRVDTEVGWTAPRPADEFVPATDRVVTVRVIPAIGPGRPKGKRVVTTNASLVDPIVRAFNALRVSPPDSVHSCPPITARTVSYQVAFSPSRTAPPDLVATVGKCGGTGVTARGKRTPNLGEFSSGSFADAVAHVFGLPHAHFN
jgi:hypothetical protein